MSDTGKSVAVCEITARRLGRDPSSFKEPEAVLYHSRDRVAHIQFNRPGQFNRISMEGVELVHDAWAYFEQSDDRVVVLSGVGADFCMGGEEKDEADFVWWAIPGMGVHVSKPIIGATAGHVLGGGFTMAKSTDMLIAADTTTFHYPEARAAIAGGLIGSLASRVPHKVAMEIMLLARPFSAQRAYEIGFANAVVPFGQHVETAMDWARDIASHAPLITKWFKKLVDQTIPLGPGEIASRMRADVREVLDSEDCAEFFTSLGEGRPASFHGR